MRSVSFVLGSTVMLIGVALVVTAMLRSFRRDWGRGGREVWLLVVAGAPLILLGRWLIL
jgi:hypothetical protein